MTTPVNLQGVGPGSNIFQLPQLGGMSFSITTNGGWYDVLAFVDESSGKPLDISGINFHAELRTSVGDVKNCLDMRSNVHSPQFVNGGSTGQLFFSVDVSLIVNLTPGVYAMDIIAIDIVSGMTRNLCELTPIAVTINQGVTR